MKTNILVTSILISLSILFLNGQPGTLRADFANNGIFSLDIADFELIEDLAILSDGSIIACGTLLNNSFEGMLIRTSNTGELIWTKNVNLGDNSSSVLLDGVVVQNDEIYVLASNSTTDEIAIIKYDINSNPINDFGADGIAVAFHEQGLRGFEMEIDSEGNLYVFGKTKEFSSGTIMDDAMVAKFKSNGQLDSSFGVNGIGVVEGPSSRTAFKEAIIIDGEIYAVGWYYNPDLDISLRVNGMIAKLKENGDLDVEFGNNGIISFMWPEAGEMVDIVQHGDGHFLAGATVGHNGSNINIFRYNVQGQLDMNFGINGEIVIDLDFRDELAELLVRDDLGIYVCASIKTTPDFGIVSLNSEGSFETSFGINGTTSINIKNGDNVRAGLLLPNGDVLLGGASDDDFNSDFTMVRIEGYPTCSTSESNMTLSDCEMVSFDGITYNQTDTHILEYQTTSGCDSTIILNVEIKETSKETLDLSACTSINVNAETYTNSGTYTQTLVASNGCDSTLTLNVNIEMLESTIMEDESGGLVSVSEAGQYQWYNCSTSSIISGATANTYIPTETGDYALIITSEMCADTSDCISVTISGVNEFSDISDLNVYPNPANSFILIKNIDLINISKINLYNLSGQTLPAQFHETNQGIKIEISHLISGLYYLQMLDNLGDQKVVSFVKE